jgi:multidrug efflux pump subunit AcrA (membrane-fusion protein)
MAAFATACARAPESKSAIAMEAPRAGALYAVHDTTIDADFDAGGTAAPIQQATLSTRLMGTVTDVLVREGDRVAAGQIVLRLDARDLAAKSSQAAAAIA